jgi:4-hydroxybenzoate polyprenyltransferase
MAEPELTLAVRPYLNLIRLHTANWEVLIFLVGPMLVGKDVLSWPGLHLAAIAVLVNAFIFVLNDVADLPRDRRNPTRQHSPLVAGTVDTSLALLMACMIPIILWIAIVPGDWPNSAEISFAALMGFGAYLDVYQKTSCRLHPLVLDTMFAICMAGPIPVMIMAVRHSLSITAWLLAIAFGLLCLALNTIGGNLKDLTSDHETGFRTTAIALGVTVGDDGPRYSPAYRRFVIALAIASSTALFAAACAASADHSGPSRAVVLGFVVGCCIGLVLAAVSLVRGRRRPARRGREPFFAWGMAGFLACVAAASDVRQLIAVVMIVMVAEVGFRLYWSRAVMERSSPVLGAFDS